MSVIVSSLFFSVYIGIHLFRRISFWFNWFLLFFCCQFHTLLFQHLCHLDCLFPCEIMGFSSLCMAINFGLYPGQFDLYDSGSCLNPVKNVEIFALASKWPSEVQATSSIQRSVGCGSRVSSVLDLTCIYTSQCPVWVLAGGQVIVEFSNPWRMILQSGSCMLSH